MKLALKKIGIAIFSISMLISFGLTSNQAFAEHFVEETCESCQRALDACAPGALKCISFWQSCSEELMCRSAVGGELIPLDNVSLILAYGLFNSWWMAPIGIGIGLGIYLVKRKF